MSGISTSTDNYVVDMWKAAYNKMKKILPRTS